MLFLIANSDVFLVIYSVKPFLLLFLIANSDIFSIIYFIKPFLLSFLVANSDMFSIIYSILQLSVFVIQLSCNCVFFCVTQLRYNIVYHTI